MTDSPASSADLDQLGEYKILGELAGREDARTYLASRREDNAPVLIAIARTPPEDDGNALSLLAADTNLLATLSHPNLLSVVEGRWIGTDAFAVITQRMTAPTLDELIAREDLTFPRIAAILREVNGLLDWAREHKIVHRAVTPDTVFVANGSDRVLAAFAISPIPFGRVSPVGVDARTIGTLAKAMLAQHSEVANRVLEQTEALLELSHTSETVPDMSAYIASIAMADALRQGEIEYAKASHAIENEQRLARERLEAERQQHDREMLEQRAQFEKERAQFEKERAQFQRQPEKQRKELAKQPRSDGRSWWNVGILAGALVVIAAATILATSAHRRAPLASSSVAAVPARAASLPVASPPVASSPTLVVDSAAGAVLPSVVPLPTNVPDSVWRAAADADSAARASRRERAARRAAAARRDAEATAASASRPAPTRADTTGFNLGFITPFARRDSALKRDTVAKPKSDSAPKRDTLPKRDSVVRRDTTAR